MVIMYIIHYISWPMTREYYVYYTPFYIQFYVIILYIIHCILWSTQSYYYVYYTMYFITNSTCSLCISFTLFYRQFHVIIMSIKDYNLYLFTRNYYVYYQLLFIFNYNHMLCILHVLDTTKSEIGFIISIHEAKREICGLSYFIDLICFSVVILICSSVCID